MIWDSAQLTRFLDEGEKDLSIRLNCIVDRVALSIVKGTYEYTLENYIIGIKRVTWKGKRLDPLSYNEWVTFLNPTLASGDGTPESIPYNYIYNDIGSKNIILYPIPNETIASTTSNLWGSEIANRVIVEFYRTPDTSGNTYRIPDYLRRRIVKCYALWKLLAQDGEGQDIKASNFYSFKYEFYVNLSKIILNKVFVSRIRGYAPLSTQGRIARPMLPPHYRNRSE